MNFQTAVNVKRITTLAQAVMRRARVVKMHHIPLICTTSSLEVFCFSYS